MALKPAREIATSLGIHYSKICDWGTKEKIHSTRTHHPIHRTKFLNLYDEDEAKAYYEAHYKQKLKKPRLVTLK